MNSSTMPRLRSAISAQICGISSDCGWVVAFCSAIQGASVLLRRAVRRYADNVQPRRDAAVMAQLQPARVPMRLIHLVDPQVDANCMHAMSPVRRCALRSGMAVLFCLL